MGSSGRRLRETKRHAETYGNGNVETMVSKI